MMLRIVFLVLQVLLGNLADRWPAMQRWNIDYLTENFGKCVFKVGEDDDKKLLMSFEDYAFYMMHQHDENPLYIFDAKAGKHGTLNSFM